MQLSVIILNYNVRYFLELCVLSVQNALINIESEIIVVDNNSEDDSAAMMKMRFPTVKFIQNNENVGFPKGNNIGVDQAKGKYICILNPDTVVAEDTFETVLAFAERQINLGIVGVKLIDGSGNFLPESKRGVPTPWVAFTKIVGLYKIFPKSKWFNRYYAQDVSEDKTAKVAILVGAFMVLKRDLYQELGGFDEDCFMYADDIDLSYRALQLDKENFYFAGTTVIHYKGESTIKDTVYRKRFEEAMLYFYKKHFKTPLLFLIFMKIGSFLFSFAKIFQGRVNKFPKTPKQYVVYATSADFRHKLALKLQKKVLFRDFETEKMVISSTNKYEIQTEIVFDNHSITFKEIIFSIAALKNKGLSFKIIPKNSPFLIGSNDSKDRGEVLEIE
ncbi:glycosyltransferase family 2 protein [Flavobacterium sp. PL002]|uniref:glycosyltransferase family 2 protein n=1 Tax=Flavobacterium sp. PL002 TaxID=1897058 RepID=UPI001787DFD3|nr:glycosyltransferase family 2 protein [Flavobacterium sp. PL002]MBE0391310.1 N-acetylglucosaminyl-diphospho-decaprenol L-rhamnosyltransferase [Flavobacterium sp. PL002]